MFLIRFRLYGDEESILGRSAAEIEAEFGPTCGLLGDIELQIGENTIGFLCEDDACPFGQEDVDYWLSSFLDVLLYFQRGAEYAAFDLIDYPNWWLEFCKSDTGIAVSNAYVKEHIPNAVFITSDEGYFRRKELLGHNIPFALFRTAILDAARKYLSDLCELNPELHKTRFYTEIAEKLDRALRG